MHDLSIRNKQINNAWYIRNKKIHYACCKTVVSNDTNNVLSLLCCNAIALHDRIIL